MLHITTQETTQMASNNIKKEMRLEFARDKPRAITPPTPSPTPAADKARIAIQAGKLARRKFIHTR